MTVLNVDGKFAYRSQPAGHRGTLHPTRCVPQPEAPMELPEAALSESERSETEMISLRVATYCFTCSRDLDIERSFWPGLASCLMCTAAEDLEKPSVWTASDSSPVEFEARGLGLLGVGRMLLLRAAVRMAVGRTRVARL